MPTRRPVSKFVYWTPRILSILFIAFLAMFSLDVFDMGLSAGEVAVAFLMHNIPVFILIALLIIAWRREIVGAATFFAGGILYMVAVLTGTLKGGFEWYQLAWIVQIAGPAFFIGVLFLMNWRGRGGKSEAHEGDDSA